MDNGNVGRGNNLAQNFERSMTEAPQFNPEILPVPEDKEKDRGNQLEDVGNNPNANNNAMYLDPSMRSMLRDLARMEKIQHWGK